MLSKISATVNHLGYQQTLTLVLALYVATPRLAPSALSLAQVVFGQLITRAVATCQAASWKLKLVLIDTLLNSYRALGGVIKRVKHNSLEATAARNTKEKLGNGPVLAPIMPTIMTAEWVPATIHNDMALMGLSDSGASIDAARTAAGSLPGSFQEYKGPNIIQGEDGQNMSTQGSYMFALTRYSADGSKQNILRRMMLMPNLNFSYVFSEAVENKMHGSSFVWEHDQPRKVKTNDGVLHELYMSPNGCAWWTVAPIENRETIRQMLVTWKPSLSQTDCVKSAETENDHKISVDSNKFQNLYDLHAITSAWGGVSIADEDQLPVVNSTLLAEALAIRLDQAQMSYEEPAAPEPDEHKHIPMLYHFHGNHIHLPTAPKSRRNDLWLKAKGTQMQQYYEQQVAELVTEQSALDDADPLVPNSWMTVEEASMAYYEGTAEQYVYDFEKPQEAVPSPPPSPPEHDDVVANGTADPSYTMTLRLLIKHAKDTCAKRIDSPSANISDLRKRDFKTLFNKNTSLGPRSSIAKYERDIADMLEYHALNTFPSPPPSPSAADQEIIAQNSSIAAGRNRRSTTDQRYSVDGIAQEAKRGKYTVESQTASIEHFKLVQRYSNMPDSGCYDIAMFSMNGPYHNHHWPLAKWNRDVRKIDRTTTLTTLLSEIEPIYRHWPTDHNGIRCICVPTFEQVNMNDRLAAFGVIPIGDAKTLCSIVLFWPPLFHSDYDSDDVLLPTRPLKIVGYQGSSEPQYVRYTERNTIAELIQRLDYYNKVTRLVDHTTDESFTVSYGGYKYPINAMMQTINEHRFQKVLDDYFTIQLTDTMTSNAGNANITSQSAEQCPHQCNHYDCVMMQMAAKIVHEYLPKIYIVEPDSAGSHQPKTEIWCGSDTEAFQGSRQSRPDYDWSDMQYHLQENELLAQHYLTLKVARELYENRCRSVGGVQSWSELIWKLSADGRLHRSCIQMDKERRWALSELQNYQLDRTDAWKADAIDAYMTLVITVPDGITQMMSGNQSSPPSPPSTPCDDVVLSTPNVYDTSICASIGATIWRRMFGACTIESDAPLELPIASTDTHPTQPTEVFNTSAFANEKRNILSMQACEDGFVVMSDSMSLLGSKEFQNLISYAARNHIHKAVFDESASQTVTTRKAPHLGQYHISGMRTPTRHMPKIDDNVAPTGVWTHQTPPMCESMSRESIDAAVNISASKVCSDPPSKHIEATPKAKNMWNTPSLGCDLCDCQSCLGLSRGGGIENCATFNKNIESFSAASDRRYLIVARRYLDWFPRTTTLKNLPMSVMQTMVKNVQSMSMPARELPIKTCVTSVGGNMKCNNHGPLVQHKTESCDYCDAFACKGLNRGGGKSNCVSFNPALPIDSKVRAYVRYVEYGRKYIAQNPTIKSLKGIKYFEL